MPYIRLPGVTGKIYVPESDPHAKKKHPCDDCFECGWCNDSKCEVCLREKRTCRRGRRKKRK